MDEMLRRCPDARVLVVPPDHHRTGGVPLDGLVSDDAFDAHASHVRTRSGMLLSVRRIGHAWWVANSRATLTVRDACHLFLLEADPSLLHSFAPPARVNVAQQMLRGSPSVLLHAGGVGDAPLAGERVAQSLNVVMELARDDGARVSDALFEEPVHPDPTSQATRYWLIRRLPSCPGGVYTLRVALRDVVGNRLCHYEASIVVEAPPSASRAA